MLENMKENNVSYKWKRIFASKAFGGEPIILYPEEAQELIDDIERGEARELVLASRCQNQEKMNWMNFIQKNGNDQQKKNTDTGKIPKE